ncbi:protein GLUTAMINE DUMPER 5-like [Abrus precatorius]|uniref:Protein GLUTAMINE DUMPER 5-like n=1 Tax=Abrus precatorius TaxID=3816 RepID=A0A8B8LB50_ABRPR|nr:protein GLUTAMINE DUMPER 5-like [Abrus precatorius]
MRPLSSVPSTTTTTSTSVSEIKIWKSPIPYLFGGLAVMLALISVALVILVCSYRKRASHSSPSDEDMKQAMPKIIEINSEPEVLVIMAGDHNPTYLARPISSSLYCTCGSQPTPSSSSTIDQSLTN